MINISRRLVSSRRNARLQWRESSLIFLLGVLSLLISAAGICAAQQPQLSADKRTQIEAAVAKFMSSTHVPGVSVAVVENGQYEWASGFGFADVENNVPASEHTLFRLASISKPLTATGAMQIWERGQLDLDAPVQEILPGLPQEGLCHYDARSARTPGRHPSLQVRLAG